MNETTTTQDASRTAEVRVELLRRKLFRLEFAAYSISPVDAGRAEHQARLFSEIDQVREQLGYRR